MNYTENLSLGLPEYGESADVAALNRNSGILDAYVYNTRQIECEPYDSTKTYMSGDLSIHNEVVYECNTDNTTGTWDDSKWDSTTLAEQIAKAKQSGGESALADLEDVEITNPSTGQALLFDDSDDKWKNQNLPDVSVTKEASGNPIEITDGASAPIVKCVTEIQGSQDLHGYDKPWVGGAGKNKLVDNGYIQGVLGWGETTADNIVANSHFITSPYMPINNNTAYTLSAIHGNIVRIYVTDENHNKLYFRGNNPIEGNNELIPATSGAVYFRVSIGIDDEAVIPSDYGTKVYGQLELGSPATSYSPYSNICPITAYTEGEIEVRGKNIADRTNDVNGYSMSQSGETTVNADMCYSALHRVETGTTYTFSGISAVMAYKGVIGFDASGNYVVGCGATSSQIAVGNPYSITFTVPNGVAQIRVSLGIADTKVQIEKGSSPTPYEPYTSTTHTTTYPSAIYRGSEDVVNGEVTSEMPVIDLGDLTWTKDGDNYRARVTGIKRPATAQIKGNGVCSHYPIVPQSVPTSNTISFLGWMDGIIFWGGGTYETVEDFIAAMSGVQLAYELATPTTTPVTPTNLPIKSLSGYNHIESSTGEMEVEYITEGYQPLVDLIQSGNGHTYSTQEQVVGTWIDGNDLYEKTITVPNVSITTGASQMFYGVVDLSTYINNLDNVFPNIDKSFIMLQDTTVRRLVWMDYQNTNEVIFYSLSSRSNVTLVLTMQYTKSTTTRSLNASVNAQKSISEPLTDKTEEVPTEEEKAVNEEENTNER